MKKEVLPFSTSFIHKVKIVGVKIAETYSKPIQTSKVKLFAKILDGWQQLIFSEKYHVRC